MSTDSPDEADFAQQARAIFAGWRADLTAVAKSIFGDALRDPKGDLRLDFRGDAINLLRVCNDQVRVIGSVGPSQDESARRIGELAASAGKWRDTQISLQAADVLRPVVRLPQASRQTLQRALGYELERLSPVSPDDVYFDFAILSRDRVTKTVEVEIRIIRRDIVDRAAALCRTAGLTVSEIRFDGDNRPADWRTFPIERRAFLIAQLHRWNLALLCWAAVLLFLAIVVAAYLRGAATADDLTDQVSTEGLRAAHVERLQQRIERATTQLAFLEKQKRAPLFVSVLSEVTRALPDGTWITELDMTGNKIRIEGFSHAASDLIGVFDRAGHFTNAQFSAPVTQGSAPGIERFDLTFELAVPKR